MIARKTEVQHHKPVCCHVCVMIWWLLRAPLATKVKIEDTSYMNANLHARQTSTAPSEENIMFLDKMVRWAEALVSVKALERGGKGTSDKATELRRTVLDLEGYVFRSIEHSSLPFPILCRRFSLTEKEIQILMIAIASQMDMLVRKRLAQYRDAAVLDYMDVNSALEMLFDTRLERLHALELFFPSSKLMREKLIFLAPPREISSDALLWQEVRVRDGVLCYVLGLDDLDRAARDFCRLEKEQLPEDAIVGDKKVLGEAIELIKGTRMRGARIPLVIGLFGQPGTGKTLFTKVAGHVVNAPRIVVDSPTLSNSGDVKAVDTIFHEAKLRDAILVFDRCETLFSPKGTLVPTLYSWFERHEGIVFLVSTDARQLDPSLERYITYQMNFEQLDAERRERVWKLHLKRDGLKISKDIDIQALAAQFEFTGGQIANAVAVAKGLASARGSSEITKTDIEQGAWAQVRGDMEEYAKKRKVRLTLDDLILPEEEKKMVAEVLDAARHRVFVMTKWGFGKRLVTGKGLCCLFVGEPGTGKTLAAEIIAQALGQNLYHISIPRVLSKYVGETEKNIERIFEIARANNSVLLFDEADALFASRVKVETSVDRFSNMEINMLLQEIERFDGIVILTSNLEKNIDRAFERRIQFKIRFPFPDAKYRAMIWRALIPKECPLQDDIDFEKLGVSFELSGGHIKNAIIRAAYRAAREGKAIGMAHLISAAEAECRAAGRLFRKPTDED